MSECNRYSCQKAGNRRGFLTAGIKEGKVRILPWLFLAFFLLFSVKVHGADPAVTDQAKLLTEEDVQELSRQVEELEQDSGWDVMAVTTEDAGGLDAETYAETWFDRHTEKDDGIICVIDMDNREITVRAFGEARFYITDHRTDKILDAGYEEITEERYGNTLKAMLTEVRKAYESENPRNNTLYDENTGKVTDYREEHRGITGLELLIAAVAALAAGGITAGSITGKYRLKFGGYKYPVEKNGSVRLSSQEDRLVNQFVTHRHIPRESSGGGSKGGRSTVHTGAGGRSSSGGSRKF